MSKKYYWLKLKNTYFNQLTQKKMKRQPNGKEMQIIYLRMLLSSIDKEGKIYYQGVYDSLEEELAEEFDESIEIVKQTINFLIDNNMVTIDDSFNCYIPEAAECIGSEWDSAERMRKKRNLDKASQCDNNVTRSDDEITMRDVNKSKVREEKELDNTLFNSLTFKEGETLPPSAGAGGAPHFTLNDCKQCAENGKVNISESGINAFFERMTKDGWTIKGEPVTNLLLAMRGFAKNHKRYQGYRHEDEEKEQENKPTSKEPSRNMSIENQIMDIATEYISQRRFDENPGCSYILIGKYVPKEAFSEKQLSFLHDKKGIFPVPGTSSRLMIDEYLE